MLVGTITFKDGTSCSFSKGRWQSPSSSLLKYLNAAYPPSAISPADGVPGYALLEQVAEEFKDRVLFLKMEPMSDEGASSEEVY